MDEEPRLEEVTGRRRKRTAAAADLDPAAARLFPQTQVPDEPVPAVLAASGARPVTRPERDPAPHAEAALRPVVRRRESNLADPAVVERDEHAACVKSIAVPGRASVLGLHLLPVTAERDVADPAPGNEYRRVGSLRDQPARERRGAGAE